MQDDSREGEDAARISDRDLQLLDGFEEQLGGSRKRKREPEGGRGVKFEELVKKDDEWCWACEEGALTVRSVTSDENLRSLAALIQDLHMNIRDQTVEDLVYEWYEENIRRPSIEMHEEDPGEWTKTSIRKHLFRHMKELSLQQHDSIQTLRVLKEWALDNVVIKKKNGDIEINAKNLDAVMKIDMTLGKLFSLKPERSVNHNPLMSVSSGAQNLGRGTSMHAPEMEGPRNKKRGGDL